MVQARCAGSVGGLDAGVFHWPGSAGNAFRAIPAFRDADRRLDDGGDDGRRRADKRHRGFRFRTRELLLVHDHLLRIPRSRSDVCQTADGIIRRWVDVFWTSSPRMRRMDTEAIKSVYFKVLLGYAIFGLIMLSLTPGTLITYATMFYNIALGVSCWHTLAVNLTLLPRELRPGWLVRIGLTLSGLFFFSLGVIVVTDRLGLLR